MFTFYEFLSSVWLFHCSERWEIGWGKTKFIQDFVQIIQTEWSNLFRTVPVCSWANHSSLMCLSSSSCKWLPKAVVHHRRLKQQKEKAGLWPFFLFWSYLLPQQPFGVMGPSAFGVTIRENTEHRAFWKNHSFWVGWWKFDFSGSGNWCECHSWVL